MRCEDYPCCGHTDGLPCDWTPESVYNDPHLLCDHETGVCEIEEVCEDYPEDCPFGGCDDCLAREEMSLSDYEYEQGYLSGSGEHNSDSYINYLNN